MQSLGAETKTVSGTEAVPALTLLSVQVRLWMRINSLICHARQATDQAPVDRKRWCPPVSLARARNSAPLPAKVAQAPSAQRLGPRDGLTARGSKSAVFVHIIRDADAPRLRLGDAHSTVQKIQ